MVQLQLQLEQSVPKPLTLTGVVREILLTHEWLSPYQLQSLVEARTGEWHSDSALTARLRELRRPEYGGYNIEKRKRENSRSYEYRLGAQ
jgi:hypothetical protein